MKNKITEKKPTWIKVNSKDIKYTSLSYQDILDWAKDVPQGTKKEDIKFEFEIEEEWGYYDDVMINATMILYYKEKEGK